MKQLFMRKTALSRASVATEEVPAPRCTAGSVVIANRYSLISAGTETAAVRRNKKDMIVKAIKDPEIRESVKDMLVKDGIKKTAERVHYETTKWTPLGYSGAGIAVEVGSDIEGIARGDLVAYGGEGHAEYVRVNKNLCVPVPERVTPADAAFVAVGSIALQAVRRAQVQVGELVAVLGLGLVGQLVSQMVQAAGARVLGSDVIDERLALARGMGMEQMFVASGNFPAEISRFTGESGVDHVIICASTSSSEVIEQAVAIARDRARITVVGMVNLDVPCEDFYRKELDLVTSRSYGPGRYDPQYEEHGVDYPLGYVRWTEQRNMQEFLRLIQANKVRVEPLVSHEFALDEANTAFETLMDHPEQSLAILLRYDDYKEEVPVRRVANVAPKAKAVPAGRAMGVAVVGCGAFARQFHLPNIKASVDLKLQTLVASSGQSAKEMAVRYGAENCTTEFAEALEDSAVEAVFLFTRDNAHAGQTIAAIEAGKHVFCEKPLATTREQCQDLMSVMRDDSPLCMVGFNRRFAPLVAEAKDTLDKCHGPRMLQYRINAGSLPANHWVYDSEYAAGRVIGEVCHFVDLATWLIGSEPTQVVAGAAGSSPSLSAMEDVSATYQYDDGSVATILYTALGASSFPKERIEVFADGTAIAIDDFRRLTIRGKKRLDARNRRGDKGHDGEMAHFARAILGKEPLQVTHVDGIRATLCCLALFDSVKSGERARVEV